MVLTLIVIIAGSVGRTCLGFGAKLHLIRPLGFDLSDKNIKRAGLDYWPKVDLEVHEDWESFEARLLLPLQFTQP